MPASKKKPCVFLDPGHGGQDPGAVGPGETHEADIALAIARSTLVNLRCSGFEVYMSRETEDAEVSLQDRCWQARECGADIFISIHCNGFEDPTAEGFETLYFPGSTEGHRLATSIHKMMHRALFPLGRKDRGMKERGELYVLKHTPMPAVLVEPEFVTNPDGERLLVRADNRWKIAEAIIRGVKEYFDGGRKG